MLGLDNYVNDGLYPLEFKFTIFQMDKPDTISSNLYIPKPVIDSMSDWLADDYDTRVISNNSFYENSLI